MNHKIRGQAIILNHENFDREEKRAGTDKDVKRLEEVLKYFNFTVTVFNDLDFIAIVQLLKAGKILI